MSNTRKRVLCIMLVSVGIVCGLSLSDDFMVTVPRIVKPAQAYIGNPLTPMSFAGVARRTARRAYFFGGGYPYGAYPYGAYPYGAYPYGGYPPPYAGYPYGGYPYGGGYPYYRPYP
jgi:hypothetical protein